MTWPEILADLKRHAQDTSGIPAQDIPEVLGVLRSVEVRLMARQLYPAAAPVAIPSPVADVWLTADEVALKLKRTRVWVYRQARRWTFAKRPTRKTLLISERGLATWLQRH